MPVICGQGQSDCTIRKQKALRYLLSVWIPAVYGVARGRFPARPEFHFIVGGASASTRTPAYYPPAEHINHIEQQARSAGLCIYEKTNLRAERLREYPNLPSRITTDGANPHDEA